MMSRMILMVLGLLAAQCFADIVAHPNLQARRLLSSRVARRELVDKKKLSKILNSYGFVSYQKKLLLVQRTLSKKQVKKMFKEVSTEHSNECWKPMTEAHCEMLRQQQNEKAAQDNKARKQYKKAASEADKKWQNLWDDCRETFYKRYNFFESTYKKDERVTMCTIKPSRPTSMAKTSSDGLEAAAALSLPSKADVFPEDLSFLDNYNLNSGSNSNWKSTDNSKRFPPHWGQPPQIQTMDYGKLPGGYGMGSSTLARWIQSNLDADAQAEKQNKDDMDDVKSSSNLRKSYPPHWGQPPLIQTMDYGKLPGGYGMGSSTLARWIQRNLDADAKAEKQNLDANAKSYPVRFCTDFPAAFLATDDCICPPGQSKALINKGSKSQGWGCLDYSIQIGRFQDSNDYAFGVASAQNLPAQNLPANYQYDPKKNPNICNGWQCAKAWLKVWHDFGQGKYAPGKKRRLRH